MKIKLLRKTLFVIMMMILTSTLIGCSHRKYTMDEKKEMVLNYMQEKYGEEFVGKAYNPAEVMKPYDVFYVYPKEKGEQSWVKVVGDAEHGQYVLIDGYFGQLIEERYKEYMNNLFDKVFDKYYFTIEIDQD